MIPSNPSMTPRHSATLLAVMFGSIYHLAAAAPAPGPLVLEASQAKGGQLRQTDKGQAAVYFGGIVTN